MSKKHNFAKSKEGLFKGMSSVAFPANAQNEDDDFLLSFKYLDRNQGQTLCEWEADGILAAGIDTLRNYCCSSLTSQLIGKKFTTYDGFPPDSGFNYPEHVPKDVIWGRIHVNGKQVIAGFVNKNIFNVVFLDKDHEFWPTKLKHT